MSAKVRIEFVRGGTVYGGEDITVGATSVQSSACPDLGDVPGFAEIHVLEGAVYALVGVNPVATEAGAGHADAGETAKLRIREGEKVALLEASPAVRVAGGLSVWQFADAARTRPANTTAYAANKIVGDAVDSAFKFSNVFRRAGGGLWLTELKVQCSAAAITLPAGIGVKGILYQSTISALADQSDYAMTEAGRTNRLGIVTLATAVSGGTGSDAYELIGAPDFGPLYLQAAAGSRDLYLRLVSTGAWTPNSASVWMPSLKGAHD